MTEAYKQPTDWRGLCEELLRELENCIAVHYGEGGTHHISAADAVIAKVDAALAQSEPEGRPAPAPVGEVAELVQTLRHLVFGVRGESNRLALRRAADLLERQATACAICERERLHQSTRAADLEVERQVVPVPVAVSERPWEREGWCHPQERWAWFYNRRIGWRDAIPPESLKPPTLFPYTHSLPYNALPLPSGEVQP